MLKKLLIFLPLVLFGGLNDDGDFQVWNTDTLNIRLSKKAAFVGQTEFRYGNDGHKLYYKHYQGGLRFIHSPFLHFMVAYRQIYLRTDDKWGKISSPFADMTLQGRSRIGWMFSDRNRIQYLIPSGRAGKKNRWLYRNRLEVTLPVRTRSGITPFVADEFFWLEARGINENRLEGGLRIPYRQKTQLDLLYVSRNLKNASKKWIHHNVFWLHFSLHF